MTEEMNWFAEDEKEFDNMTITQLEKFCEELVNQESLCDKLDCDLSLAKEKREILRNNALTILDKFGKDKYESKFGTIYRSEIFHVNQPQSESDKAAFFQFLKERNIFDSLISVHSKRLTSFVKAEMDLAKEEGRDFKIPGITKTFIKPRLGLRKAKS